VYSGVWQELVIKRPERQANHSPPPSPVHPEIDGSKVLRNVGIWHHYGASEPRTWHEFCLVPRSCMSPDLMMWCLGTGNIKWKMSRNVPLAEGFLPNIV